VEGAMHGTRCQETGDVSKVIFEKGSGVQRVFRNKGGTESSIGVNQTDAVPGHVSMEYEKP